MAVMTIHTVVYLIIASPFSTFPTVMACFRPDSLADPGTLPALVDRCFQTRLIPSWAHSAMAASGSRLEA